MLSAKKVCIITIPYMSIIQNLLNSKKYLHPSFFESSTLRHDKMIIQLLAGQTTAPPVRLNFDLIVPATGVEVIVMGWGLTYGKNQQLQSSRLLHVSKKSFRMTLVRIHKGSLFPLDSYQGQIYSDMACTTGVQVSIEVISNDACSNSKRCIVSS